MGCGSLRDIDRVCMYYTPTYLYKHQDALSVKTSSSLALLTFEHQLYSHVNLIIQNKETFGATVSKVVVYAPC